MFVPVSDMFIETVLTEFMLFSMSATRPPQPFAVWIFGIEVCHCSCWSEWENRLSGRDLPLL